MIDVAASVDRLLNTAGQGRLLFFGLVGLEPRERALKVDEVLEELVDPLVCELQVVEIER